MKLAKLKVTIQSVLKWAKAENLSKTKIGAIVVTGLTVAVVVVDAVYDLSLIFN